MAGIDIGGAFKEAEKAINGIVGVGLLSAVGLIVLGTVINAVTGGSITLPTGFNAVLHTFDALMSGWFTTATGVISTIVALVVVVVLIVLFRMKGGKSKSGGSMV